jgi:hypothetical protein
MIVSSKTLLNILSKGEIKDVVSNLKKRDIQTSKDLLLDIKKDSNIKEFIDTLLKDLSKDIGSKDTILEKIKSNELPKVIKGTQKEIVDLLNNLKKEESLKKFEPELKKLLLDIKNVTPKTLKETLLKSGISLEAKIIPSHKNIMPKELKDTLLAIKEQIKSNIPKDSIKIIDNLLKTEDKNIPIKEDIKSLTKSLLPKKDFVKIENFLAGKKIDFKDISLDDGIKNDVIKLLKLSNSSDKVVKSANIKEIILNLKKSIQNPTLIKTIDALVDSKVATKEFIKDIKFLINSLKSFKSEQKPIILETVKLHKNIEDIKILEQSVKNLPSLENFKQYEKEIKRVIGSVKQDLLKVKDLVNTKENLPVKLNLEVKNEIENLIKPILQMPNLPEAKEFTSLNLSVQIQRVVNILKSELITQKEKLHVENVKLANTLEKVVKEHIFTKKLVPNQKFQVETSIKTEISNDIKSTLLNIKKELSNLPNPNKELNLQVDRVLGHIEYFQLVSLSSNTFTTYLPFLWNDLQEGKVSFKKLKQNRYFCEINLKLKDYDEIDLILMLFDDIYINMSIFTQSKEFISLTKNHLKELKMGFSKLGLIASNIDFFNKKRDKNKTNFQEFISEERLNLQV